MDGNAGLTSIFQRPFSGGITPRATNRENHIVRNWVIRKNAGPAVGVLSVLMFLAARPAAALEPVPDKLVVLTFDDSVKSQFTHVRPILKKYHFGATFFITEGFEFSKDKRHYLTWDEIARLHKDGFEIGNHTRDHYGLTKKSFNADKLAEQIEAINRRCKEHGIPRPISFAYPGNGIDVRALPILRKLGMRFARRGGEPEYPYKRGRGFAYQPGLDDSLLIPSAGDARPDWTLADFKRAVRQAQYGRIAVVQFHGVPDEVHPWVNTSVKKFRAYMKYLADNGYTVIALRDLAKYIDPSVRPVDPFGAIRDRQRAIKSGSSRDNTRKPTDTADLRRWLQNMVWYHHFTTAEIRAATGLSAKEVAAALRKYDIRPETRPKRPAEAPLLVLPYPGGRHPRIGFLDGAIRPQRETKLSVFLPWNRDRYVVLDLPEAIRRNDERKHGLLYLAHTHVDTMWTKQNIPLKKLEWTRHSDGSLSVERKLPNGVVFGTKVVPGRTSLRMEMWLTNGSTETLRNLRVQNCVMLKEASEFAQLTNDNKHFSSPYAAVHSADGRHWVITAWESCRHAWGNARVPCLHSDPQFPDCKPGETKRLRGWFSFYDGADIKAELARIEKTGWRKP